MRNTASEKLEIIRLVEGWHLPVKRTLEKQVMKIVSHIRGASGTAFRTDAPSRVGDGIGKAGAKPERTGRHVHRRTQLLRLRGQCLQVLLFHDLITSLAFIVMKAADEFRDKTTAPNQLWQTDFTFLSTILNLVTSPAIWLIIWKTKACRIHAELPIIHKLGAKSLSPVLRIDCRAVERWYQTLKNRILRTNYVLPSDFKVHIAAFVGHYIHQRYYKSLNNLTPANIYTGRGHTILLKREKTKSRTMKLRPMQHAQSAGQPKTDERRLFEVKRPSVSNYLMTDNGEIVITFSVAGHSAVHWGPVYSVSSWAKTCFVQTIRQQFHKNDIRDGSVSPGPVSSALYANFSEENLRKAKESGRLMAPGEGAGAVLFTLTRPRNVTIRNMVVPQQFLTFEQELST